MLKGLNIRSRKSCPYNPRSNAVCERLNRTLLQLLRAVLMEYAIEWDKALPYCAASYNSAYHRALNSSPAFLYLCRDMNNGLEALYGKELDDTDPLHDRIVKYYKILDMTREAIYATQKERL